MYSNASKLRFSATLALLCSLTAALTVPLGGSAGATQEFVFERIAGRDRFDTARVISAQQGPASTVVLARGDVFADALAGAYLAGINGAPILLTRSDGLPPETDQAIDAAGATKVLLLGGPKAISPAVETHLQGKGLAVERVGGLDRYDTSALVARHGGPGVLGTSDGLRTAIVVSGANFPDALSGGPVSYAEHFPTLLTTPGVASPSMLAALEALEIRQVIIIGGPTAVAAGVESAIRSRGLNVNRLFGQDRSGTSVAVARIAVERFGFSQEHLNVARGDDFADALAFTAHAGRDSKVSGAAPIYLTISSTVAGRELVDEVRALSNRLDHGHIVGGLMALSQEVEDELTRAARAGSAEIDLDYTRVVPGGVLRGEVRGSGIGLVSVSGCGLRGTTVREGAGAFEFEIPETQPPGTCSLTFTTNFANGGPNETDRKSITVEDPGGTDNQPTTTSTQPGSGTTTSTTQPGGSTTTTTTQPGSTTTTSTTQSTTTTTPPADIVDLRADDSGGGNASAPDIHQIVFARTVSSAIDDPGSSYVIRDSAGNAASVECSVNAICFILPAGTYNGRTVGENQAMRVRLLETPRKVAGADDAPVTYPATLVSAQGWTTSTGQALGLAGDLALDASPIDPARTVGFPTLSAATETGTDRLLLTFNRPVTLACGGSPTQHQQFAFEAPTGTFNPSSVTVTAGSIQLNFSSGPIEDNGTSEGELMYGDASSGVPDCGDVIDLSGNAVANFGPVSTVDP